MRGISIEIIARNIDLAANGYTASKQTRVAKSLNEHLTIQNNPFKMLYAKF